MTALPGPDFRDQLRQAGITPDKPLHAILSAVHEAAQDARQAVLNGSRGLTPEGERELVGRVALACGQAADRAMVGGVRLSAWRAGAVVAIAILAALVGGYAYGVSRPVATAFGDLPREVVEGLRANDLAASWRGCIAQPAQQGREWCYMPVWRSISAPAPK